MKLYTLHYFLIHLTHFFLLLLDLLANLRLLERFEAAHTQTHWRKAFPVLGMHRRSSLLAIGTLQDTYEEDT